MAVRTPSAVRTFSSSTSGPGNIGKKRAEKYAKELHRLESIYEVLTPEIIVDEAEKSTSPLHDYFDWDISSTDAKRAYWLSQASTLLRKITVRIETPPQEKLSVKIKPVTSTTVRAFTNVVTPSGKRGYISTETAMHDEGMYAHMLNDVKSSIRRLQEKVRGLSQFRDDVDEIEAQLEIIKQKLSK